MTINPLQDHVVLAVQDAPEKTADGRFFIPEKARQSNMRDARTATVLAVGPGRMTESGVFLAVDVVPGEHVLMPTNAGIEISFEGKTLRMIRSCELLGKIEERRIVGVA